MAVKAMTTAAEFSIPPEVVASTVESVATMEFVSPTMEFVPTAKVAMVVVESTIVAIEVATTVVVEASLSVAAAVALKLAAIATTVESALSATISGFSTRNAGSKDDQSDQ